MVHPYTTIQAALTKEVKGRVCWKSPSNIALIKYWGKRKHQIPNNPSISFTLDLAHTITEIKYQNRNLEDPWISFQFKEDPKAKFRSRIENFFQSLLPLFPFLTDLQFDIKSWNSFPHSSGIASSASSMSALALCLCEIEKQLSASSIFDDSFYQKASYVARMGSGSASRSVYRDVAVWGQSDLVMGSSDIYSIPFNDIHPVYKDFHDDIIIVSSEKKSISSSLGHKLMDTNPYADSRYKLANRNLANLLITLRNGNLEQFGEIVEAEALGLHALMMCSCPSFILLKPNTLIILEKIRRFRAETNNPVYFTLDAGPNVHILYPESHKSSIQQFISNELLPHAEENLIIKDHVGQGPQRNPDDSIFH